MFKDSYNTALIDRAALQHNFRFISARTGSRVMAMVKADAYGHGAIEAAKAFWQAGCRTFGVAELREAVALREAGIGGEIFVTIGVPASDAELIFKYQLTPVIYNFESAKQLAQLADARGTEIKVHVKVDSGMGRLGLEPADVPGFVEQLSSLSGWAFGGLMSHFPEADQPEMETTQTGYRVFSEICDSLTARYGGFCHIANSGGILNYPGTHREMVRAGIALYGYHPKGRTRPGDPAHGELVPAMSFTTEVLQVKKVPAGRGISYGHTYTTDRESRIAVVPVGYEDGFSRSLSNRAAALVDGQKVPVRGRICMNMCMLDVTGIHDVQPADEVVFLGRRGNEVITADDIADQMGSISYEVLCMLGNNNNRKYI